MKNALFLCLLNCITVQATAQDETPAAIGWLPSGQSWFEFSHRVVNTGNAPALLDQYYRGKFVYGWWKPIWRGEHLSIELTMVPQFLYGGFFERRILLPAFNFRGELAFRYRLSDTGLELWLSNLHYSTHVMDKLPVTTLADQLELSKLNIVIDDINMIRLGAAWRGTLDTPLSDELWAEAGVQPWRMNYWLITELDRFDDRTSYEPYERRLYFGFELSKRLGPHRITLHYLAETEQTIRSKIELRYTTNLNRLPTYDGLQIYLAYEGGHIASNEVTITPHNGISRDWLVAGIRIFN